MSNDNNRIYAKERYDFLKDLKICCHCGAEPAMMGFTRCPDCAEKESQSHAIWARKNRKYLVDTERNRRETHKAAGLCRICNRALSSKSAQFCDYHRQKDLEYKAKRRRAKGIRSRDEYKAMGICIRCTRNRAVDGKTWCESCITQARQRFKNVQVLGQEKAKQKGWNWKNA